MKQRKPVRFVTLRGPLIQDRPSVPSTRFDDSSIPTSPNSTVLLAEIRRLIELGEPTDEARRRVAAQFMESSNYVFRNPLWKPLLGLQSTTQALIAQVRQSGQSSEFAQQLDDRLQHLLTSETEFTSLYASLWQSYFANLIMETVRVFDRPALIFWIRLFHVLDRLRNNEDIAELIDRFDDIQPDRS